MWFYSQIVFKLIFLESEEIEIHFHQNIKNRFKISIYSTPFLSLRYNHIFVIFMISFFTLIPDH